MLRPRANEVPELIRRLGSRKPTCVDAARARLAVIGPRAVERLIDALEGDDNRIRSRVMPLLALIQDPRGREPLIAMLLDRNIRLREAAARALAGFPSHETVVALNRLLDKERGVRVRAAAVESLVEQYALGQDQAICRVLELLSDTRATTTVRQAALSLLPRLRSNARRSILARLENDPDEAIRALAERYGATVIEDRSAEEIQALVADLASSYYPEWNKAVQRLAACGSSAIRPLLSEMQSRAHDPEYCKRAGIALKAMGPHRGRALADMLDEIEEPLPLQVLVESIGAMGDKRLIYRLKDLIDRLAERPHDPADVSGWDPMERVRAMAHLELARIGSRVAVRNLRDALADPDLRVEDELLAAVELIGKREEIGVLVRAYAREDEFMRRRIADVIRTIMRRERIRRNSRTLKELGPDQLRSLRKILPPRRAQAPRS